MLGAQVLGFACLCLVVSGLLVWLLTTLRSEWPCTIIQVKEEDFFFTNNQKQHFNIGVSPGESPCLIVSIQWKGLPPHSLWSLRTKKTMEYNKSNLQNSTLSGPLTLTLFLVSVSLPHISLSLNIGLQLATCSGSGWLFLCTCHYFYEPSWLLSWAITDTIISNLSCIGNAFYNHAPSLHPGMALGAHGKL